MKTSIKRIISCLGICLALAGCASNQPRPQNTQIDNADIKLGEAALSVSQSLSTMAVTEQTNSAEPSIEPPLPSSYGMGALATVDWTGPIEPIVRKIASATHYQLRILGTEPSVPIIISAVADHKPIGDILRNIGYQAGKRADVIIFPSTKTIELRYAMG